MPSNQAHRNRSSGWQYAKLSGHANEATVKNRLDTDSAFQRAFLSCVGLEQEKISHTTVGGLREKNVLGVLGKKTKSKTDLTVYCTGGRQLNVSIKKSLGGQVYLVRVDLFFQIFEKQFNQPIPARVRRAMELFWAAAPDALRIIQTYADRTAPKQLELQKRHKSLNATTLKNYDISLYQEMLAWFCNHAYELAALSFARGAVAQPAQWSEYIWYINTLGENQADEIFCIKDICVAAKQRAAEQTFYGDKNGGSTIQLPFGFVQWHQGKMQFHHDYQKVKSLCQH